MVYRPLAIITLGRLHAQTMSIPGLHTDPDESVYGGNTTLSDRLTHLLTIGSVQGSISASSETLLILVMASSICNFARKNSHVYYFTTCEG